MERHARTEAPRICSVCEFAAATCDICNKKSGHCMKYHTALVGHLAPCEYRATATVHQVNQDLRFANDQLAQYYNKRHNQKHRPLHVRGLTRRLTITPDFFRR